jgi:DNA-binding transcriptional MerR regulator
MPQKGKKLPQLLTLKQTSKMLQCHPNTLRMWDKNGILKAVRIGSRGDRRYNRDDVLKIIKDK